MPVESLPGPAALRWLAFADIVYVAGGIIAYYTRTSAVLLAAVALVPALPGILDARRAASGDAVARLGLDRALSAATGTFAIAAMLVLIPYMATEEGHSLWSSRSFAAVALGLVSLGFLLWNTTAFQALAHDAKAARLNAAFHGLLIVVGLILVAQGDGTATMVGFRGQEIVVHDLAAAPAIMAVPGLVWAVAFWRLQGKEPAPADAGSGSPPA